MYCGRDSNCGFGCVWKAWNDFKTSFSVWGSVMSLINFVLAGLMSIVLLNVLVNVDKTLFVVLFVMMYLRVN